MRRNLTRLLLGASCVLAIVATAAISSSQLAAGSPTPVGPHFKCPAGVMLVVVGDVVTCKRSVASTVLQSKEETRDAHCAYPYFIVHLIGPDSCKDTAAKPICDEAACPADAKCGPVSLKVDHLKSTDKCVRTVVAPVPTTIVDYFAPK